MNRNYRAHLHSVGYLAAALIAVVIGVMTLTAVVSTAEMAVRVLLLSTAVLLVPCWWAVEVRRGYPAFVEDQIRQHLDQERHAELLAEQARRRTAAVEEERRRMARELHDVVSAQVSAMAITSGAVLNSEPNRQRDRQALQTIRTTSLTALEELRQMVQMLRSPTADDDDAAAELLTETTWDTVLKQARHSGLAVTVDGTPPEELPTTVRAVLLRILQEALSNAHRHGPGQARVQVQQTHDQLKLMVTSPLNEAAAADEETPLGPADRNTMQAAAQQEPDLGSGNGLAIMQERATSIGGRVSAGNDTGLRLLLQTAGNIEVIGEAADGQAAVQQDSC